MTVVHRSGLRVAGAAADDRTRARPIEHHRFRAGDRVVVRPIDDILATLDVDGTLRGLPFMPEMLGLCGQSFYVERRAEKTCVDIAPELGVYPHRRFIDNDVVVLSGPRCDGRAHDGCKRACKIFWKEEWLRPFESGDSPAESAASGRAAAGLKTKSDEHRYFCQSTQLRIATEEFPGRKKPWMLRVVLREIHNGDRTVAEIVKLIALTVWQVVMEAVHGKGWLQGPHRETTPAASLGLKPGDKVRIKSRAEMVGTLNQRRRNRGMSISSRMTLYCEGQAEVLDRLDRMIDERSGLMREMRDTVTLKNLRRSSSVASASECLCENVLGDCPRGEPMYWREIWLERRTENESRLERLA